MKLSLEVHALEDVTVVHCRGRIIYRDEAAALSARVINLDPRPRQVVLDLGGVDMIDSAGLGELVVLFMWAEASHCSIKLAEASPSVRKLLELTNLSSVFEIYSSADGALKSCRGHAA